MQWKCTNYVAAAAAAPPPSRRPPPATTAPVGFVNSGCRRGASVARADTRTRRRPPRWQGRTTRRYIERSPLTKSSFASRKKEREKRQEEKRRLEGQK
jgi:hypothetical protein